MSRFTPQDLDDIKARNPLADVAGGYVKLRRAAGRMIGPCPICGGKVTSQRFEILDNGESWVCAVCPDGGDVIRLVQLVEGCDFLGAIERLGGRVAVDPDQARKLFEERERKRLVREKTSAAYREAERKRLYTTWKRSVACLEGTPVERYLQGRGLMVPEVCPGLRFLPAAPYWHGETIDSMGRKSPVMLHSGPAMLAAFIRADGTFGGLHTTWLDGGVPPAKIELTDPATGEALNSKKMRGSKTGAHITVTPLNSSPRSLVIGEGIETVLAVWTAYTIAGRPTTDTEFWAAGDLGNLAGRALRTIPHPTLKRPNGRAQSVPDRYPDPDDPGLAIPDSVEELILLGDGDSEPLLTECAMERAARRYAKAGRTIRIAFAPAGSDFNDLLRSTAAGANAILSIVDSAPVFVDFIPDPAAIAEAVRKFGLAELDAAIAIVRAAEGDARGLMLQASSQRLGQLAAAGALHEGMALESLLIAAGACGLIRDDGVRAVKKVIADAIKLGKKQPRDLSEVRGDASAALRALHQQRRPREAADIDPSSAPADVAEDSPQNPSDASSSFFAAAPAPPDVGESDIPSQTGALASKAAAAGGAGGSARAAGVQATASANGARGNGKPPRAAETERRRHMRLAFFPLTDLGNAERFRERYLDKLLWCPALGWLAWDGKRWSRDGADDLVKIAEHDTVRAIQDEAREVRESGNKDADTAPSGARDYVFAIVRDQPVLYSDKIASWGRASEALNKLGALSKRGAPYFAIGVEKLDADKMKINVNNGTLVVARKSDGEDYVSFQPHDPDDLITKISPVDYNPDATCPEYDKFIARVQPLEAMRVFLHQWLGLSLTGDVSEQKLAFLYGKGSNGKSVLVDAVSHVAGDYGETVPIETFLDHGKSRNAGQATPDLAILPGVRMLRTSEPEKNSRLAEAMVKLVTGGEPIQARHLNRDFFKFYPQFKLTISGNYRPTISGADEGIWRRLRLVPFNVTIPKEERDIHLSEKLRAEASGILNRLLDGLRLWCDKGLIEPEAVTAATAQYRSASDPLGRFLAACVVESPGDRAQSSALYQLFEAWCKSSGETAWKQKGFSMAMEERGYQRMQSSVMWFLDIKMIRSVNDFVDSTGNPVRVDGAAGEEKKDAGDVEF